MPIIETTVDTRVIEGTVSTNEIEGRVTTSRSLAGQAGLVVIDSALSTTSKNPVQNKVIALKLNNLDQDIDELNTAVGHAEDDIDALETAVGNIKSDFAAEYDATATYAAGDYVMHEGLLYRCTTPITVAEAWNAGHWELVSVGSEFKALDEKKANTDGYYQQMTSGYTDNLTPYSADSGTSQNTPFILQGSGCANGEEQADTGSYCQLQRKNGNTVTVNQNIKTSVTPFSATSKGLSFSCDAEGIVTVTGTIADSTISDRPTFSLITLANSPIALANRKYLFKKIMLKNNSTTANNIKYGSIVFSTWDLDIGCAFDSRIASPSSNIANNLGLTYIVDDNSTAWDRFHNGDVIDEKFKLILIDLTLWFGSNDKIPTHLLNHPEDFFRYYQGDLSYNVGTLTDCNGRYLKTKGRNIFDGVSESGYYDATTGEPMASSSFSRSKNEIRVSPNTTCAIYYAGTGSGYALLYDIQGNYTGIYVALNRQVINLIPVPANACVLKFYLSNAAFDDIVTVSLYYLGESGYDKSYPYEELANIDTGNEPLLAFDYKTPDGVVHKNTGRVDLGTLTWLYNTDSASYPFFTTDLPNGSLNNVFGGICAKYECVEAPYTALTNDKMCGLYGSTQYSFSRIAVRDSAYTDPATFKTAMSGVYIEYELADASKTTEQGTPFPENVAIDDFGTMSFDCPNGVPQGNLMFYPVDYKAEFDTLHNITEGDMHKIALKGDLAPTDPDTIKGVVDYTTEVKETGEVTSSGILRQLLAITKSLDFANTDSVDLGVQTWSIITDSHGNFFKATISGASLASGTSTNTIILKGYAVKNPYAYADDKIYYVYNESNTLTVVIRDSSYATVDALVAGLKGVLLAYEKATT